MSCCPYTRYYTQQAGSGVGRVYRGAPFQRGFGFFGNVFSRFGVPLLKYLGKQALSTGAAVASDILGGASAKESFQQRAKETGRSMLQDAVHQAGSGGHNVRRGRRKRQSSTKRCRSKKPRSDIFD